MQTQGRKEIGEAVLIAALSGICAGLITLCFEEIKRAVAAHRARPKKPPKVDNSAPSEAPPG